MNEFTKKLEVEKIEDGEFFVKDTSGKETFVMIHAHYPVVKHTGLIEELVRRWNSHDKRQKQSDLLTLGLLQEKQKTSALLSACEKIEKKTDVIGKDLIELVLDLRGIAQAAIAQGKE